MLSFRRVRLALGVPEQSAEAILSHCRIQVRRKGEDAAHCRIQVHRKGEDAAHCRIQVRRKGEDAAGAPGYSSTCFHLRSVNSALYSCDGEEEVKHSTRFILFSCQIQVRRKGDDCCQSVRMLVHLCPRHDYEVPIVLVRF